MQDDTNWGDVDQEISEVQGNTRPQLVKVVTKKKKHDKSRKRKYLIKPYR